MWESLIVGKSHESNNSGLGTRMWFTSTSTMSRNQKLKSQCWIILFVSVTDTLLNEEHKFCDKVGL